MFLPSSGQETETIKTHVSQANDSHLFSTNNVYSCFLKPGMQPKGIIYNPQANLAPPFFSSGNMGTNTHIQLKNSKGCYGLIKMEGALQVLKAFIV